MALQSFSRRPLSTTRAAPLVLAAALLLLAWLAAQPLVAPAAVPASASQAVYSAERAMEHLRVIAAEPHTAGSAAQARVRDYLLARLTALGLTGEVQAASGLENVVVRLPGTASTGVVLVTGHYDSAPTAPGAGDDGISVAAMLETLRVLQLGPALKNDVTFVFTDGEERGWLGAIEFIRAHPELKTTAVALVFDARPGGGPLSLRETSAGDAWLVRQLAAARPPLWAGSWLNADERTDTDTEFSAFYAAGFVGVEIENMARGTLYHTAGDNVAAISLRQLQAQGDTMLRLARHFGGVDLSQTRSANDVHFFSVPLLGLVAYPAWLTPAAWVLAAAALVGLALGEWRRGLFSLQRCLLGLLAFLAALITITLATSGVWAVLLKTLPLTREVSLGYPDFPGSTAWMASLAVATLVLSTAALYALGRRIDTVSLAVGGLLAYVIVWSTAFLLLDGANPLTTPYIVWPFVGGVAGLAALALVRQRGWLAALLGLAVIPILVLLMPILVPQILTPDAGAWVPVLILGLLVGLLVPQMAYVVGRLPANETPPAQPRDRARPRAAVQRL